MSLDEICALKVAELATPGAGAVPMGDDRRASLRALSAIAAWGFEYRSRAVWLKDKVGLGYWVHNQHELLLIAARGDMPAPSQRARPPSVITAPRREHSRKPDEAYELIERMYPELPKIELFARTARAGWARGATKHRLLSMPTSRQHPLRYPRLFAEDVTNSAPRECERGAWCG